MTPDKRKGWHSSSRHQLLRHWCSQHQPPYIFPQSFMPSDHHPICHPSSSRSFTEGFSPQRRKTQQIYWKQKLVARPDRLLVFTSLVWHDGPPFPPSASAVHVPDPSQQVLEHLTGHPTIRSSSSGSGVGRRHK